MQSIGFVRRNDTNPANNLIRVIDFFLKKCLFNVRTLYICQTILFMKKKSGRSSWLKYFVGFISIAIVAAIFIIYHYLTKPHNDTAVVESKYEFSAMNFIQEFHSDLPGANKKYAENIITVNGRVSELEKSDSLYNIKMIDSANGSYIIFNFQNNQIENLQSVKKGDSISIKGSCSNGNFSRILDAYSITFKRCIINSNFNNQ